MIIYNVTIKIDHSIHNDWLSWMREVHILDVLKTGLFTRYKLCKLLQEDERDGVTYAVQYYCNSMSDYFTYQNDYATKLQADHAQRYEGKYVAFRTLLRLVEEAYPPTS